MDSKWVPFISVAYILYRVGAKSLVDLKPQAKMTCLESYMTRHGDKACSHQNFYPRMTEHVY